MILQHCPKIFKRKAYGCGFGPIHPTMAFLDYWGKCPKCGKRFKPFRKSISSMILEQHEEKSYSCQVTDINGNNYCNDTVKRGKYCSRHEYLNFDGKEKERKYIDSHQLNLFEKGEK